VFCKWSTVSWTSSKFAKYHNGSHVKIKCHKQRWAIFAIYLTMKKWQKQLKWAHVAKITTRNYVRLSDVYGVYSLCLMLRILLSVSRVWTNLLLHLFNIVCLKFNFIFLFFMCVVILYITKTRTLALINVQIVKQSAKFFWHCVMVMFEFFKLWFVLFYIYNHDVTFTLYINW